MSVRGGVRPSEEEQGHRLGMGSREGDNDGDLSQHCRGCSNVSINATLTPKLLGNPDEVVLILK